MRDEIATGELDGAIIQRVIVVDQVARTEPGPFRSVSLPGHLLHVVTAGQVEQYSSGTRQRFGSGQTVWYHENETIAGEILEAPWEFYTVNFLAPTLAPPPFVHRIQTVGDDVACRMRTLLSIWRDAAMPPTKRHIRVHSLLLEILFELVPDTAANHRIDSPTHLWWAIEAEIRSKLADPIGLGYLEKISRRNRLTINRACRRAVGMAPMKRIKQLRLSYARGLVSYSDRPMTDIALSIGYGRVQEFSRDYHRHFHITPTEDRKKGPRYRQLDTPDGTG